ncbi:MAG: hypothetical protein GX556_03820 [Fibrobacter sp.]|nr:hypothetical protein [Fibrobacter sp.]
MLIICKKCGSRKAKFREACKNCGYKPKSDHEIAEAVLLSDVWFIYTGLSKTDAKGQVLLLQEQIRNKTYVSSDSEIQKARKYLSDLAKEEWWVLLRVLRFLSPLFLIILIAGIIFCVRNCT